MGLHCFKKHVLSTNFHGNRKGGVKKFFYCKRMWKAQERNQISIYPRTMNIFTYKEPKLSISILSRALLKKIYRKVAFSNLIISFGDSSRMLKFYRVHSKGINFLSYCSAWWNELWSETYKTVQNPKPAICRCSARELFLKIC